MIRPDKRASQGVNCSANAATLAIMLLTGLCMGWFFSRAFQPDRPSGQSGTTTIGEENPHPRKVSRPQAETPAYGRMVSLRSDLKRAPQSMMNHLAPQQQASCLDAFTSNLIQSSAEKLAMTPLLQGADASAQAVSTAVRSISPAESKSWLD